MKFIYEGGFTCWPSPYYTQFFEGMLPFPSTEASSRLLPFLKKFDKFDEKTKRDILTAEIIHNVRRVRPE